MIDDISRRRKLELEIDQLLIAVDGPETEDLANRAKAALKDKKLDEAQRLVAEAKAKLVRATLYDRLVSANAAVSRAAVRRLVESGAVFVDGLRAKSLDQDATGAASIRIGTKEIL